MRFLDKLQSPTLSFLINGGVLAALGSRLTILDAVHKFIVFMLLVKVGLSGGIANRNANLVEVTPTISSEALELICKENLKRHGLREESALDLQPVVLGGVVESFAKRSQCQAKSLSK